VARTWDDGAEYGGTMRLPAKSDASRRWRKGQEDGLSNAGSVPAGQPGPGLARTED
jgi:hypothetical protein